MMDLALLGPCLDGFLLMVGTLVGWGNGANNLPKLRRCKAR
jgi:hypothetical protein